MISVITVVKNHPGGLRFTGKSLDIQQSAPDFEWLVIDGADQPSLQYLLEQFPDVNSRLISESDDGLYYAMNKGIVAAKGDYLWFLNAGDCLPDLHTLRDVAKTILLNARPDFIYGDSRDIFGRKVAKDLDRLHYGQISSHQSMIYRRGALNGLRYDTRFQISADYDFTARFVIATQNHVYLPRILCDTENAGLSARRASLGRSENAQIRNIIFSMNTFQNKWFVFCDFIKLGFLNRWPRLGAWLRQTVRS